MVEALRVLSYNVQVLNSPIKRKKMLTQLKQLHCQIAFIQESHLSDAEHRKLNRSWANQVFFSSHQSGRKCGVAILIHKMVQFSQPSIAISKADTYWLMAQ